MSLDKLDIDMLPARTVMTTPFTGAFGGDGGYGGDGGDGGYATAVNAGNINYGGEQHNTAVADASGGDGGDANGGAASAAGRDQFFGS